MVLRIGGRRRVIRRAVGSTDVIQVVLSRVAVVDLDLSRIGKEGQKGIVRGQAGVIEAGKEVQEETIIEEIRIELKSQKDLEERIGMVIDLELGLDRLIHC